jgi:hypothetical protein
VKTTRALFFYPLLFFGVVAAAGAKVQAAQQVLLPKAKDVLQLPAGCLKAQTGECAVSTRAGERYVLTFGHSKLTMGSRTAIIVDDQSRVSLVRGVVWIEAGAAMTVRSEYGEARSGRGEFWIVKSQDRVTVTAVDGEVELRPRGASDSLWLLPGLENHMGHVRSDGVAATGVPVPLNWRVHIRRWARLFDGSPAEFKERVMDFQEKWQGATLQAAAIHGELLARKVASLEAEHAAREDHRRKVEARNREMVEMFRRRVFGEL